MHNEAYSALRGMLVTSGIDSRARFTVLDIGGRQINDSIRDLLPNAQWTGLDIKPGPHVDIVADATTWTPDQKYHVVFCTEVFEHTPEWRYIIGTCAAALCSSGFGFFTCASTGRAPHGAEGTERPAPKEHYRNIPAMELQSMLETYFKTVYVAYQYPPGDAYAWTKGVH